MKREFTLDSEACAVLDSLAEQFPGGADAIVNQALHMFNMEKRLDEIEADPEFQALMDASERDIREGRTVAHEDVEEFLRKHRK